MHEGRSVAQVAPGGGAARIARAAAWPLALIVSLFFLWGVANSLNDILIKQFKKAFELSDFQAGLVQSAFYLGYFVFALPAGVFMRRHGYKGAVVAGLALYAAGAFLFWPAASAHAYGLFLLALFVLASGLAFLETSANPLMTVLGPAEGAARRLNLAQAFNPLGAITGVLVGRHFILSGLEHTPEQLAAMAPAARQAYLAAESATVQVPYLVIGLVVSLWAVLVLLARFPRTLADGAVHAPAVDATGGVAATLRSLAGNARFVFSVAAQFFYVGAQVAVWSFLIRYAQDGVPGMPEKTAADWLTCSLVLFMLGRFAGTALLRRVAPAVLLALFAAANVALAALAIAVPGMAGLYAMVGLSFFMSVMFPTIFALGLEGLDHDARKLGSSLLVMSIIGGAVLAAATGLVSDLAGIRNAVAVPMGCFAVVLCFALHARRGAR